MTKDLKDPFAGMGERKTDIPFFAAQAYAAMQINPMWMVEYISLRAHEGAAASYRGIPVGVLDGNPEVNASVGRLMNEVVRVKSERLKLAEDKGRRLFREAVAGGRLHVFADYPGNRLGDQTNDFRSVRLEPPSDPQWIDGERGGVAVVSGFSAKTYLDRYQFVEWLEEVLRPAGNESSKSHQSAQQATKGANRRRLEKKLTLRLLAREYKQDGTIGMDTANRAAEKIVGEAYVHQRIPASTPRDTAIRTLAQHIRRLQESGEIEAYLLPASFGEPEG